MPQVHSPVGRAFSPFHGHHVMFGARRPVVPIRHMLHEYRTAAPLPAPPAPPLDFSGPALAELSQMNSNDMLGCCVEAQFYHHLGLWTGNAGKLFVATPAQVVSDYSSITGYTPGNPASDQGTDPVGAYEWWAANPAADGSVLAGAMGFDASAVGTAMGQLALMQALDLFEGVSVTLQLPAAYTDPMPSAPGFVWDVAGPPDPRQGHCFLAYGYTASGLKIVPWGGLYGTMTWAAVSAYCTAGAGGMLYILLDPDQWTDVAMKAGNGLDRAQLLADFPALGGNTIVNPSAVSPGPTPVIVPPTPASTALSLAWDEPTGRIVLPAGYQMVGSPGPAITIHPHLLKVAVPRGYSVVPDIA
jgi:hypothetical protein